jgi:hypothetical protein
MIAYPLPAALMGIRAAKDVKLCFEPCASATAAEARKRMKRIRIVSLAVPS